MGNQKQKWTPEEEEALLAGVAKHGPGKWKNILRDPDFAAQLTHRSNIDLKDKWRNLSVAPGTQGSKDKIRTPKLKAAAAAVMAAAAAAATGTATPTTHSSPAASLPHSASSDLSMDDNSLNVSVDAKNTPRYDGMIFEALSSVSDANGSDISAIVSFIAKKHEVPLNFRRILGSRLRRLAAQGKLEKAQSFYKISDPSGTRSPAQRQKETNLKHRQSNSQSPAVSQEMVEEAAITAAYKVVEAENKVDVAKGAVEELERMTRMAEDTEVFLEIAKEIHERCSRGEVVLLA
ncbi:PREDICTED: telomere repeat-binding factor 4-like isoform X2 [Tarenaya hassleriana]|uniref:telomere repeat-binding factor 4-like isoform X2 n=1 Tax=Tarenaya hassleriana TaxID=28532 RepID=UPI00053C1F3B|nr:PREDICTED: telomere repeat-binding factor 4-like isoform X2 [Tarenaya hassleriana]